MTARDKIAWKIAQDLKEGEFVSLGHGIPYLVGKYISPDSMIFIQNEPGVVCFGPGTPAKPGDYEMRDSMNRFVTDNIGGSFFDTAASFCMIRGKHLDKSIMGAYQVDAKGNFSNWKLPGKPANGIGGAMDLAVGAKQVIVAMETTTKDGKPKLVDECSYPVTGRNVVSKIYTEVGVFEIHKERGFVLTEIFPECSCQEITDKVGAHVTISEQIKKINILIDKSLDSMTNWNDSLNLE